MPIYIAFLRGINVGSHKRMKMEKLVASCAACGFADAKTYIQSGNVVLKAAKMPPEKLSKKLEAQIAADFGFSADVITRTRSELEQVVSGNPMLKQPGIDPERLHVVFLRERPEAAAIEKLQALTLAPDLVRVGEQEVYFYFPNGVSKSSLWKHPLDNVLKVSGTMRNWKTVNQMHQMAQACK